MWYRCGQSRNDRMGSMQFRVSGRLGFKGWLTILVALTVVVAIGVAIAIVAVSVFLFLLPVLAVAAAIYYLLWRLRVYPARQQAPEEPVIIAREFRILDAAEIERDPRGDGASGNGEAGPWTRKN